MWAHVEAVVDRRVDPHRRPFRGVAAEEDDAREKMRQVSGEAGEEYGEAGKSDVSGKWQPSEAEEAEGEGVVEHDLDRMVNVWVQGKLEEAGQDTREDAHTDAADQREDEDGNGFEG